MGCEAHSIFRDEFASVVRRFLKWVEGDGRSQYFGTVSIHGAESFEFREAHRRGAGPERALDHLLEWFEDAHQFG